MKGKFARWDILFLQYLKRDWKKIIFGFSELAYFQEGLYLLLKK